MTSTGKRGVAPSLVDARLEAQHHHCSRLDACRKRPQCALSLPAILSSAALESCSKLVSLRLLLSNGSSLVSGHLRGLRRVVEFRQVTPKVGIAGARRAGEANLVDQSSGVIDGVDRDRDSSSYWLHSCRYYFRKIQGVLYGVVADLYRAAWPFESFLKKVLMRKDATASLAPLGLFFRVSDRSAEATSP